MFSNEFMNRLCYAQFCPDYHTCLNGAAKRQNQQELEGLFTASSGPYRDCHMGPCHSFARASKGLLHGPW